MAALPLTLDILPSPTKSPLMSPLSTLGTAMVEPHSSIQRPTVLTLADGPQPQHSKVSPTSAAVTHGNISPALSSVSSLSPSFLPEMPQWKRDLIQRRKQNVQRTISASSPTSSPQSASPSMTPNIGGGGGVLKNSISSSSMRSLAGSNTNIDQVASDGIHSPTKDFNKLSSSTAAKVNKQHATTIPGTIKSTSAVPAPAAGRTTTAITITSPNKETTAKLFGGQYTAIAAAVTATTSTSTTSAPPPPTASVPTSATVNAKEEITKDTTMEEEYLEKSKKTKEYQQQTVTTAATTTTSRTIKTLGEEDEEVPNNITTTGIKHHQQQQHMATRLTGSSSYSSSSSTTTSALHGSGKREFSMEREQSGGVVGHQQQCYNITGANIGSANQSSSKCESERLVCAANNSGSLVTTTTTTTNTVVKISQKLQENQFIKNEQQHKTKIIKTIKTNNTSASSSISTDLKSPTKTATTSSPSPSPSPSSSSSSPFAATNNCAIKKKMVAMQEMKKSTQNSATQHLHPINSTCSANSNNTSATNGGRNRVVTSTQNSNDLDSNEDLSYGPGIVSKLRCRYLSLALRESMEQQRLNKDLLRRSTSLNNLLDDDHAEEDEDDEEDDEHLENIVGGGDEVGEQLQKMSDFSQKKGGILKNSCSPQEKRFSQGSNGVGVTFTETSFNKRSRHLKRGNDSLKRARSVEALLSEKSPWQGHRTPISSLTPTCVTIEDKIQNARERLHQGSDHMPPKRLTSIIDDTERPPPDLVKQTLKMFEASANRRPRCTNRSNSKGDVASKVETFKNIIKDQKPVVTYPKPVSPTKKLNTPNLVKPNLKSSSDLLQTPLGRKTMAVANSHATSSTNTLSEHTPDIIPRQKLHSERELNKEKYSGLGINKEKYMNSLMEPSSPLGTTNTAVLDSNLKSSAKEKFLSTMVDSPVTSLSDKLARLKISDNSSTPPGKGDNFTNDNLARNGGSGGSGGGVDCYSGVDVDDAFHNDDQYTTEEMNTNEFSSLKSENDKIKQQQQINNEIQSNSNTTNATAGAASTTGETAATVKAAHSAHSSSDLSDGEDDDEYGISTTKRITRTALDNIAKAGTTQQFKFSNTTHSSSSPNPNTTTSVAGKQIGVIRPLPNTSSQQQQQTTTTSPSNNTTQKVVATDSNMETLKHSSSATSLTSREIEKNRINDLKKSSSTSSNMSPSSSPSASLDNVIKSSSNATTGSNSSTSSTTSSASGGYSEVDTVISATNSPLWAMRKRRQNPPAPPAEQTSMVFNFSNRKEVPDYIESDGVIFRPKRQLPKPNESGFVLLGDLSVETSTDMDYDDFSMCPPSPCDVEFVNANIVIDGKSSIRQKSKDATFRVQFNDTLTSTFEYPSEASLIVEDSFTALSNDYPLPGEVEFNQTFQHLVLDNSIMPPLHHVADEIIQLPTTNESSSSPANTTNNQATKNILGNLPLDCPDLEKATLLTVAATQDEAIQQAATQEYRQNQHNNIISNNPNNNNNCNRDFQELPKSLEIRKSRKDLKLPLLELQQKPGALQKPPVPVKSCQMKIRKPLYLKANIGLKQIESIDSKAAMQINSHEVMNIPKPPMQQGFKALEDVEEKKDSNGNSLPENKELENEKSRKMPRVLSHPKYACFLRPPETERPIQRSRSNEFRRTLATNLETPPVFRSNSLRNFEKNYSLVSSKSGGITTITNVTTTATSLYFTPDVNLSNKILSNCVVRDANDSVANFKPILPPTLAEDKVDDLMTTKSLSLINLTNENLDLNIRDLELGNPKEELTEHSVEYSNLAYISNLSLPNLSEASNSEIVFETSVGDTSGSQSNVSSSLPNLNKSLKSLDNLSEYSTGGVVDIATKDNSHQTTQERTLSLQNLTLNSSITEMVTSSLCELKDGRSVNHSDMATLSLPNLSQNPNSINDLSDYFPKIIGGNINDKILDYTAEELNDVSGRDKMMAECSPKSMENIDIAKETMSQNPIIPNGTDMVSKNVAAVICSNNKNLLSNRGEPSLPSTRPYLNDLFKLSVDSLDDVYEDALSHILYNKTDDQDLNEDSDDIPKEYMCDLIINELPAKDLDYSALTVLSNKNQAKDIKTKQKTSCVQVTDLKSNDDIDKKSTESSNFRSNNIHENNSFDGSNKTLEDIDKSKILVASNSLDDKEKVNISLDSYNNEIKAGEKSNRRLHENLANSMFDSQEINILNGNPLTCIATQQVSSRIKSSNLPGPQMMEPIQVGSAPLGFYTPMKAPIDKLFQLGVTRAPTLEPSTNGGGGGNLLNGLGNSGGSIVGITSGLIGDNDIDGEQEPESLQYIKPADDDLNIAYSEGTQKTDLLY